MFDPDELDRARANAENKLNADTTEGRLVRAGYFGYMKQLPFEMPDKVMTAEDFVRLMEACAKVCAMIFVSTVRSIHPDEQVGVVFDLGLQLLTVEIQEIYKSSFDQDQFTMVKPMTEQ